MAVKSGAPAMFGITTVGYPEYALPNLQARLINNNHDNHTPCKGCMVYEQWDGQSRSTACAAQHTVISKRSNSNRLLCSWCLKHIEHILNYIIGIKKMPIIIYTGACAYMCLLRMK